MKAKYTKPQTGTGISNCPHCGYTFPNNLSLADYSDGPCPACGLKPGNRVLPMDGLDDLTDEWLDGERAAVRSRRPYGEPPFR